MAHRTSPHLVCAVMAALIMHSNSVQAQSADRAGEVVEILQTGLQLHAGSADLLGEGDAVIRNARLETDGIGEMALALDDGSQLVVMPDSEIVVDRFVYDPSRTTGQAVISLGRGALRMISGRLPSDRYQVNTPVATIGLRGTDFTAELVPGSGLVVRVDEGAVEIRPTDSADRFTVSQGQVSVCNSIGCRNAGSSDRPLRQARLGPPPRSGPGQQAGKGRSRAQAGHGNAGGTEQGATAQGSGTLAAASGCPPYAIPDSAYRRVGLDPVQWPRRVDGITFYRHVPDGLSTTHYCPYQIDFTGGQTSFTVMGQAASGDTKVLYYVNTLAGQAVFQPGFDRRAKARDDAAAYEGYMSLILDDQPDYRITKSDADVQQPAPDRLVLQQRVHARVRHGEYLVSGVTLYRPVAGGRTGLFAIPAVVTPKRSGTALTAVSISRPLYRQLAERSGG